MISSNYSGFMDGHDDDNDEDDKLFCENMKV